MEENSIERDIHLLESYAGMTHKMTDNQGRPKLDQAIEHILSDYKRVLKENEELNYKLHSKKIALEIYNRYIPKSKIKAKIEQLKMNANYDWMYKYDYQDVVKMLQELLEEGEE